MEAKNNSFLDQFAGQGLETISQNECATAFLGIVQPGSGPAESGEKPGTFRNSATGENYGNVLTIVPVAFRTVWVEKDESGKSVGRYEPRSIEVEMVQPKPGKRGYPTMMSKAGNKVTELFDYAVVLPEHPDAGVLILEPSVMSMRALKSWNSQLRGSLLPNGQPAPIFAFTWDIALETVDNPVSAGKKIARIAGIRKNSLIEESMFIEAVQPKLAGASKTMLSITSIENPED